MSIKPTNRYLLIGLGILAVILFVWFFSSIIVYVLISLVLSMMGEPLVELLRKIPIGKKKKIPISLCALITLFTIMGIILALLSFLIPVVASQAEKLSTIDPNQIGESFREPIQYIQTKLISMGVIGPEESVEKSLSEGLLSVVNLKGFTGVFSSIVGLIGQLFVAFFTISFVTFFFLRDERMFVKGILLLSPEKYHTEIKHVYYESKKMLSRYFLGLALDVTIIIILITLGMWLLGVENFLMIGVIAGILNVIPYIGCLIGAAIGIMLALTNNLEMDFATEMVPLALKMSAVFIAINLTDGMVLQPNIFSSSVKAHPLEIFLVIMMAGTLAGIPGMIVAIPAYTVMRIFAKQFFSRFAVIKKLTEDM